MSFQWTRADTDSVGMDRTVWNGTGFSGQYHPQVHAQFESLDTTPDDLLLWFHHVPWTQRLKSTSETVIQHFYNAHYAGAATANTLHTAWESLASKIDAERFGAVLFRLNYQAGHSLVWRDAINTFYHNMTGIPDSAGRVGVHPYRIQAENMTLSGYKVVTVPNPIHASAPNYQAIVTSSNTTAGTASTVLTKAGTFDIAVNYFDHFGGKAKWETYLGSTLLGSWNGTHEDTLGHAQTWILDGTSAARETFRNVRVNAGDVLKIVGTPDRLELAAVDYVSVLPLGIVD
jgi:alpha-glucuronidase